ncbi:MAG: hypothetical protein ACFFBD_19555 [Candidatus Hodarchaeota archaeon]
MQMMLTPFALLILIGLPVTVVLVIIILIALRVPGWWGLGKQSETDDN